MPHGTMGYRRSGVACPRNWRSVWLLTPFGVGALSPATNRSDRGPTVEIGGLQAREALAGADHGHRVAVAGAPTDPLDRAGDADRRDHPPGPIADRRRHARHSRLPLGHALR